MASWTYREGRGTRPWSAKRIARPVAKAAASIVFLIGFGIFCVTPDGTGFVQALDSKLAAASHIARWRPTMLSEALGSPVLVAVLALASPALLWQTGTAIRRRLLPIAVTAGAGLAAWVPGVVVRRPSPGHLGDLTAANATSFPSIGAAMATGLAFVVVSNTARTPRRDLALVIAGAAVAVSVSARLLTRASWPLDEAAGALLGAIMARPPRIRPSTSRRIRSSRLVAVGCLVVVATLIPVGRSYLGMLRAPGNATFDQRSIEWLRDNGLSHLVDRGESWWVWRHLPSPTATISELPPPPVFASAVNSRTRLPTTVAAILRPALDGEGHWTVAATDQRGNLQIATTSFRPDAAHPSLVAAAAWINSSTTRFTLIAGTRQPGGGPGPAGAHVPAAALDSLIAAFNSGYRMNDTPGGALMEGRTTRDPVDGFATLAIRPDGRATVGEWGTDLTAEQGYTGIRQNLHLMIRHGAVVEGVPTNAGGRWGTVRNTLPTWRSGIGVTAAGDLVYVAGDHLTLGVLANALLRAGAITAMELDIHRGMVTFNLFTHQPHVVGHKLLPNMTRPADRYLKTDWRDFVMVTSR